MQVRKLWHILSYIQLHSSVCLYVSLLWSYLFSAVILLIAARKVGGGEQDGRSTLKPAGRLDCSFVLFIMESYGHN